MKKTKEICEAATGGPWKWDADDLGAIVGYCVVDGARELEVTVCGFGVDSGDYDYDESGQAPDENDKAFILHARTALPELVEWAEKAKDALGCNCTPCDCGLFRGHKQHTKECCNPCLPCQLLAELEGK